MRNFACPDCASKVFFANVACVNCGAALGFNPQTLDMSVPAGIATAGNHQPVPDAGAGAALHYCANAVHDACNWLVFDNAPDTFCVACKLNRTIPNLTEPGSLEAWQDLERAKKRLIYSLLRFGLPLDATNLGKGRLTFDFLRQAMTGHLDGVVTINIMEADAVERERQRQHFDEPYRSLLGHFRHESGHFYWEVLVEASGRLEEFRALFGDEREDYGAALERHHADGPPSDWQTRYVSSYASVHPWEDWAESWAHYVHMVDAVETAESEGIEPRASGFSFGAVWPFKTYDVYREAGFETLRERWIPLTIALNRLNRSMGHNDFYSFVTPEAAYEKLAFVHRLIRDFREKDGTARQPQPAAR